MKVNLVSLMAAAWFSLGLLFLYYVLLPEEASHCEIRLNRQRKILVIGLDYVGNEILYDFFRSTSLKVVDLGDDRLKEIYDGTELLTPSTFEKYAQEDVIMGLPSSILWEELTRHLDISKVVILTRNIRSWFDDIISRSRDLEIPRERPNGDKFNTLLDRVAYGTLLSKPVPIYAKKRYFEFYHRIFEFQPRDSLILHLYDGNISEQDLKIHLENQLNMLLEHLGIHIHKCEYTVKSIAAKYAGKYNYRKGLTNANEFHIEKEVYEPSVSQSPGKLQIIGAGLSKTGTTSLSKFLSLLGYESVHGMNWDKEKRFDTTRYPTTDKYGPQKYLEDIELTLLNQTTLDFQKVDFRADAIGDLPWATFSYELSLAHPNAKVILLQRDMRDWIDSWRRHMGRNNKDPGLQSALREIRPGPEARHILQYSTDSLEPSYIIKKRFMEHYHQIKLRIPPERLLEVNIVKDPIANIKICKFLRYDTSKCPPMAAENQDHNNT